MTTPYDIPAIRQRKRNQRRKKTTLPPRIAIWSPDGSRLVAVVEARGLTPEDLDVAYALACGGMAAPQGVIRNA
ncbi:hypothetical protein ACQP1V_43175 (plasmid) [Microtetraspora malaysiensis]|uniref:hypothetical protein n=1 Tax=Microtetraspora malaysiensis TaxID=161358 RepID=UPI003D92C1D7